MPTDNAESRFKYDISYVWSLQYVSHVFCCHAMTWCIFFIHLFQYAGCVALVPLCRWHDGKKHKWMLDREQAKHTEKRMDRSCSSGIIHQVQCLAELIACATFTFCTEPWCLSFSSEIMLMLIEDVERIGKSALKLFRFFRNKWSPPHFYGLPCVASVQSSNRSVQNFFLFFFLHSIESGARLLSFFSLFHS